MHYIIATALLILLSGCAKIPPAAPELSSELGKQITAFESANLTLLSRFFDLKREAVDRFMQDTWVPTFSENYFAKPAIASAWNTIVAENDTQQRAKFIIKVGTQLQVRINQKRHELIAPLDELERTIAQNLRNEYSRSKTLNNTLTSLLSSASDVTANRERYLAMAGIDDNDMGDMINKTDEIVSTFLEKSQQAEGAQEQIDNYLAQLKKMSNSLKGEKDAD